MHYLLITTLIWAFSFGLIGEILKGLDPLMIGSARLVIALLFFLPFLRTKGVEQPERLRLIGIGAVQFGVMYSCYLSAFRFIPSHLVALFSVLTPVYVVFIYDIRHRTLNPRYLLAAILSVAGAAVIKVQTADSGSIWLGFALMQIAGIAFAFGQVAYRDWKHKHMTVKDSEVFGYLYTGGALTALLAYSLISPNLVEFAEASLSQWAVIFYLGAVASGLGFYFWNKGATISSAGALAAFNNALVPIAMAASLFIFGEIRGIVAAEIVRLIIGAVMITAAVFVGKK